MSENWQSRLWIIGAVWVVFIYASGCDALGRRILGDNADGFVLGKIIFFGQMAGLAAWGLWRHKKKRERANAEAEKRWKVVD